jgi:hypothetical protein
MTVGQIGGTITGLSSEELRHADVNLHASVNNTAPVEITGTINPFTENRTNELKITAVSVDLTPGSPYVGKFAGYRLARGKLDMDMAYHLQGKQIKSENLIVLDQFTFGEKVDSPDATKLPVRLAIAILKDRDGKIHLDVPIEGSLDDPEFRLGKVIAHAIGNVITKIATSPFAALGALLGGKGEEVAYQDFDAGSFALLPAGKEKLDSLLKALYERPALQLDIEGSVDPDADLEGLKRAALEKEIRQREWMSLRKSERETTTPEQVTPAPENHLHWLKQLYSEAVVKGQINPSGGTNQSGNASGRSPATGASSAGGTGRPASTEPEKGATALMQGINLPALPAASSSGGGTRQPTQRDPLSEAIVQALLPTVTVGDSDFQALAAGRAKAVRDYLLQSGKVEAERVSVVEIQPGAVKSQGSRAYLQLK